jgi:GDP-D-mannose 3', 5'-epimerase
MEQKKICITGGAGMIGASLTRKLLNEGNEVTIIDNLWRGKLENLFDKGKPIIDMENNFHNIDLSKANELQSARDIFSDNNIIIHLADIVAGIGYVFENEYEIFKKNMLINTNTFKAADDAGVAALIYAGTACSFPMELQQGLDSGLNDSQLFPANPESAYGWSKLLGQIELRYLSQISQMRIITLIFHNAYGPYCEYDGERTQVIPSLIRRIIDADDGDEISVWGSGDQGRAFVHVDDIVDAILKAILTPDLPEYMQIGPSNCTSIKELVEMLVKISNKDLKLKYDLSKPEGDKGRFANASNAKKYLNWKPRISLEEGLESTYKWIKNGVDKNHA